MSSAKLGLSVGREKVRGTMGGLSEYEPKTGALHKQQKRQQHQQQKPQQQQKHHNNHNRQQKPQQHRGSDA